MTIELVEGHTGPVPLTLKGDGAAENLTGLTVAAEMYDKDGNAVTTTGDIEVTSAAAGEIEWTPDVADLDRDQSPYELRFKVTGSDGSVYYPNQQPIYVVVRR